MLNPDWDRIRRELVGILERFRRENPKAHLPLSAAQFGYNLMAGALATVPTMGCVVGIGRGMLLRLLADLILTSIGEYSPPVNSEAKHRQDRSEGREAKEAQGLAT